MQFESIIRGIVERTRAMQPDKAQLKGMHVWEHIRDGKVINILEIHNDITNEGRNGIMNCFFNAASNFGTSYMSLIGGSGYSALANTDVMASHPGWTEFTGYSESSRPAWGQGTAASQQLTNAVQVTFSINTSATVKGGFITNNATKGGTTGNLWATGLLTAGDTSVNTGDTFKNSYILLA